jgi:branched-chain amino acid transport system ATP-binding protein
MSGALLRVDGLTAGYGEATILEEVSLQLASHGSLALLGRNGAGKSTLVASLMGLTRVHGGAIAFRAHEITHWRPYRRAHAGMGWVPQEREVFRSLSVTENLTVIARPGGWTLRRVHELFPRLAERGNNLAHQLSGGEQQMLAIGRCLMSDPELIMFDEPSLGLAPAVVQSVLTTVRDLNRDGLTCVLVEQNVAVSLKLASHAYVLENGRITLAGSGEQLLRDDRVRQAYLGL